MPGSRPSRCRISSSPGHERQREDLHARLDAGAAHLVAERGRGVGGQRAPDAALVAHEDAEALAADEQALELEVADGPADGDGADPELADEVGLAGDARARARRRPARCGAAAPRPPARRGSARPRAACGAAALRRGRRVRRAMLTLSWSAVASPDGCVPLTRSAGRR